MPGLAPRMNVLFWGRQDFQISFASRDTSRNAWNLIDTGILSNNIKFLSHECLMTFWSLNKYNDNPPPIRLCVNPWPFYQTRHFTDLWEVSIEHLRRMLTRQETWSRPIFGLAYVLLVMINPFPELVFSFWTFHFEHPSVLSRFFFIYPETLINKTKFVRIGFLLKFWICTKNTNVTSWLPTVILDKTTLTKL